MTIHEAANALSEHLQGFPWLTAIGVGERDGEPCIFLYVSSLKKADLSFLREGWRGFPVVVKKMGTLHPLREPMTG